MKEGLRRQRLSLILTSLMLLAPIMAAAPVMAETGGIIQALVGEGHEADGGSIDDVTITDVDYHGVCGNQVSWTISSNVVCTGSTFTVSNYININNGGSLTLEQNSVLSLSVPYFSYSYKINIYGTFKVMNSTVKSASSQKFYGIYAYSGATIRYEGATIKGTYYYGTYAYSATSLKINNTAFSNGQYYGIYVGMTSGYIMNSTFTGYTNYGVYANNLANMNILNNTMQNCMYGANLYSFNSNFYDNTMKSNSYYGLYLYNSNPSFSNNVLTGNSQAGLYVYGQSDLTIRNSTLTNNGQRDFWLEAAGGTMTVKAYNTIYNKAGYDINGWGGGTSKLQIYWYSNISVKWLSDGSAVKGADVTIEDQLGNQYPTELVTNGAGEINWLPLMEYEDQKSGKSMASPHWVNATADLSGRDIMNFTQLDVSASGANKAELFLDDVPPPLVITSPENDFLTNSTNITIEGRTEAFTDQARPVSVQIRLKGTTYEPTVNGLGEFSQVIPITSDGKHDITIKAFDWVFNEVQSNLTVFRDTKDPPFEILAPVDDLLTNISTVNVEGTTEAGAILTVNDVVVDVNADGEWSTIVKLEEGENTIMVKAVDPAQNQVQSQRHVTLDTIAPRLIVNEPDDDYKTNDRNLRVAGITEPYGIVFLNDKPVLVAGGSFQSNYQLSEGENTLVLDAVDTAGNHNITKRSVFLDTIPPSLEVTSPMINNLLTSTDSILVKGFVDPGSKLLVNKVDVGEDGEWSYEVDLREGKNKITVDAFDEVGNKITIARTVILDTTAPMLAVFNPEDGLTYSEDIVYCEGSLEPKANLTINGDPINAVGGIFSTPVDLVEGENTITIQAKDMAGNTRTEKLIVSLDTTVNLDVDTGMDGKTVKTSNLTLKGNTDPGARVFINGEAVGVRADGEFSHNLDLNEGNNTIVIQAYDEFSNMKEVDMAVTLKTPSGGIGTVGGNIGSKNNMFLWMITLVIMIAAITSIVGFNVYSRRKARGAQIQKEADKQADALKRDGPQTVYDQIYGQGPKALPADQYSPSVSALMAPTMVVPEEVRTVSPIATAKASAVDTSAYNITESAQMKIDETANRIKRFEAEGKDTTSARRNLRLAKQFAARGNSEKSEYYSDKALDILLEDGVE